MKWQFIIFFGIFFSIYFAVNYYIFIRGWQALEIFSNARIFYAVLFWVLALSYILGRLLENYFRDGLNNVLVWAGSFWLAFMAYFFFSLIALDIGRSLFVIFGKAPQLWINNYLFLKFLIGAGVVLLSSLIVALGFWNSTNPKIKNLEIRVDKDGGDKKEWNIAIASDIHAGAIINNGRFNKLVENINQLNPDLVLFAGDTIDEDIKPVIREDIGASLTKIKSKYGIYAITGNHEYIGGIAAAAKYLTDHGLKLLRDETVLIDNSFYLVGRDDRTGAAFASVKRKNLNELLKEVDTARPIIMLDHQPFSLGEVAQDGRVDAQFSGHTHHGQLWPFNYITELIFEVSWGFKKINNTNFYVSSGWGTWGPPIRVGNTPELIQLKLIFK